MKKNIRSKAQVYDIHDDVVAEYMDKTVHTDGCSWRGGTIRTTARQINWWNSLEASGIHHHCPECGAWLHWKRGRVLVSMDETMRALMICGLICREYAMDPYASSVSGSFSRAEICGATYEDVLIRVSYGTANDCGKSVSRRTERLPRSVLMDNTTAEEALQRIICDTEWEHEDYIEIGEGEQTEL